MKGVLGELYSTNQTQSSRCGSWESCYHFSVLRAQMISVAWDISNAQVELPLVSTTSQNSGEESAATPAWNTKPWPRWDLQCALT